MGYRIQNNTRCGVIGYGSWATALVHTLEKNKKEIWWHIRNEEVLESMQTEGRNAKYLSDIEFNGIGRALLNRFSLFLVFKIESLFAQVFTLLIGLFVQLLKIFHRRDFNFSGNKLTLVGVGLDMGTVGVEEVAGNQTVLNGLLDNIVENLLL